MKQSTLRVWSGLYCLFVACQQSEQKPSPEQAEVATSTAAIYVAAASDLVYALPELSKHFGADQQFKFSFGSTGLLAKQIAEGAPFDLFLAANVAFVDDVIHRRACSRESKRLYGRGQIVAWTKKSSNSAPLQQLEDLLEPRFSKIAIANPEHAPYGRAAKEALEKLGLWQKLQPRLIYGENIQQTFQYAKSGNAEVAIIALSLAIADQEGTYLKIEQELHNPIDQALVVCKHGKNRAGGQKLADFITSEQGRAIFARYGFVLPDSAPKVQ